MATDQATRSVVVQTIRRLSVPILLVWVAVAAISNIAVPNLEDVAKAHNVSLNTPAAPSFQAMQHIGKVFHEYDSDSAAMIVRESDKPLGDDAHRFYDALVGKLEHDTKHVEHVQNFWGDPLTAAGSQSQDGKAAYVQVYLAGNQGDALADESVDAIRHIVEHTLPPQGVKAYVTGAAPLVTDQFEVGSKGIIEVTVITVLAILAMLLWVYRFVTAVFVLVTVIVEMAAARGIVAFLGSVGLIGLSTYATNLLTLLAIAAGTDYAIFFVGRYHEARHEGQDRETAYYPMYRGTTHVVLGSGLTVAGAVLCLRFTRLNYFQSLGIPAAIGIGVALATVLSLTPAVITVGSLFGLFDPKRQMATRGWRRIGTAIVRWPGPILVVATGVALVGLLALPGYRTKYDARPYMPASAPANTGYTAAERHFSQARLNPELLIDRDRSRHAQSGRHDQLGARRQSDRAPSRHRPGPVHDSAPGHPDRTHLVGISDQRGQHRQHRKPAIPEGAHGGSAQAGRQPQRHDRHSEPAVRAAKAARGLYPRRDAELSRHHRHHQRPAGQDRELRRFLPAGAQLFLLGEALFRHSGVLRVPIRLRRARWYRRAERAV